jgi:hypothetical protein
MTADANHMEELLGPEPTAEQPVDQVEVPVETVAEEPQVVQEQQEPQENKQTPEQIAENYKRMAHAERMERKQIQQQLQTMQQRFEQLFAAKQPEADEPVYEEDPLGATYSKVDKVIQSVEQLKQVEATRQQQEQYKNYVASIQQDETNFMQKNPDYRDAVTFIQSRRMNELQAMGYDEQSAMMVLAQDAQNVVMRAQEMGESPAAFAYRMAKQLGYAAKQQQNLDQVAAGQQVAKSVAGGAKPISEGSLPPNLAELSDAEFDALFKKMNKG